MPTKTNPLISLVDKRLDSTHFREQHWEGSFWEYLDIVVEHPAVGRNAFQRVELSLRVAQLTAEGLHARPSVQGLGVHPDALTRMCRVTPHVRLGRDVFELCK